jgi:hypothetical protein
MYLQVPTSIPQRLALVDFHSNSSPYLKINFEGRSRAKAREFKIARTLENHVESWKEVTYKGRTCNSYICPHAPDDIIATFRGIFQKIFQLFPPSKYS